MSASGPAAGGKERRGGDGEVGKEPTNSHLLHIFSPAINKKRMPMITRFVFVCSCCDLRRGWQAGRLATLACPTLTLSLLALFSGGLFTLPGRARRHIVWWWSPGSSCYSENGTAIRPLGIVSILGRFIAAVIGTRDAEYCDVNINYVVFGEKYWELVKNPGRPSRRRQAGTVGLAFVSQRLG